ncbi:lasso peptide biosynthesis B2 protein [Nonomuraea candida]|uniref:lasso peptide biosynthesis B2 protein n=1 Tax=Nonomuraea candida TaxID=359159 RepID=UPI00069444E1|nr:lasso peptide biosynthesis B2 protein [Nonomuraea candida]
MSAVLPEAPVRPGPATRLLIGLIVPVAGLLGRMPPRRLRRRLARLAAGARPAGYAEAKRARDEILTSSPRCRGRTACLTRSIAVLLLCRSRGTWPTWCVGVIAAPPFAAHAWVEADGRMVDEPVDSSCYRTFFTVPAGPAHRRPATSPGETQGDRRRGGVD